MLTMTVSEVIDESASERLPENTKLVMEISLGGLKFASGTATISTEFGETVPEGKVAKVYYIDDEVNKTDMNATFADGKVTFTTTHFSTYAVVFEDAPVVSGGLSAGAIAGIVIGSVVLAIAIACVVVISVKKKKQSAVAPADRTTKSNK